MPLRLTGPTILTTNNSWTSPLRLGTARIWYDATNGYLRIKIGSNPTSISDGNAFVEAATT